MGQLVVLRELQDHWIDALGKLVSILNDLIGECKLHLLQEGFRLKFGKTLLSRCETLKYVLSEIIETPPWGHCENMGNYPS